MILEKIKATNFLALFLLSLTACLLQAQESKTTDFASHETVDSNTVLSVGYRAMPRSVANATLPIDIITSKEFSSTGQNVLDKALTYRLPYFNSVNAPVKNETSLLDPYGFRGMGANRTLVLLNGTRKNISALVYTRDAPGYGDSPVDISAIPVDAIERIEILKDGAAAQYGSDAIAGVMNIVLKEGTANGQLTFTGGITGRGDGETLGLAFNNGHKIGGKGFINYTADLSKRGNTNRAGTVNAEGDLLDFVYDADAAERAFVEEFLSRKPDGGNITGSPETTAAKFITNMGYDILKRRDSSSLTMKIYGNALYTYKKVNSFANYRMPYWRTIQDFPYLGELFPGENPTNTGTYTDEFGNTFDGNGYDGYLPTFNGTLHDYNGTLGLRTSENNWVADFSFTLGGNEQTYEVKNSHNRSYVSLPAGTNKYRENSPLAFDVGGTRFSHILANIDVSKRFTDKIAIGFGAELRREAFTIIPGDEASYEGRGPDSFIGNDTINAGTFKRHNFGGYADLALDLTDDFLVNAAVRLENYNESENIFAWKVSTSHEFMEDKITLRAAVSNNFRAPTLQQLYMQKTHYNLIFGYPQPSGLISTASSQGELLGLPQLRTEKSINITAGLSIRPDDHWQLSLDYYNIALKDRVVLSSDIFGLNFFANAMDSRTSGLDLVAAYRGLTIGKGHMHVNLSGNYMIQNERKSDIVDSPFGGVIPEPVFNSTQEALFFTSRPQYKAILGIDYNIGKFGISLNNTLFGPTQFRQQGLPRAFDSQTNAYIGLYTEFSPAVVMDLGLRYRITDKISTAFNVNNLFNVLPEWSFKTDDGVEMPSEADLFRYSNAITFNQRYAQTTYDGFQFSQLGTIFNLVIHVKL